MTDGVANPTPMGLLPRLRAIIRGRLARNIAALSLVRAADQLMPLLVLPFLARVLEPAGFGLVAIAQSLALYGIISVQYAFEFSGTRAVARDGPQGRLPDLVAGIVAAQLMLAVIVALGSIVVYQQVSDFTARPELLLATLAFAITQGLYPLWYFTGQERVHLVALIGITGKAVATIGVFVVVGGPGDEWRVLACYAGGATLASLLAFALMLRETRPSRPSFRLIGRTLREGFALFTMRLAVMMHTAGNVFLLGLLVPPAQVAVFAAGEKLVRPIAWLLQPINVALMPRLSRLVGESPKEAQRLAGWSILLVAAVGLLLAIAIAVLAPWVVLIVFGEGYETSIPIIRIMALIIPLMVINAALISQWMIPNGLDRPLNLVIVTSTLLNIGLALVVAPRFGAEGMAWVTITVAAYILLGLLIALQRHNLRPQFPSLF